MEETIIGRSREELLLESLYKSKEAEMAIVYGRRRVGKTFLVREHFRGRFSFVFTGLYQKSTDVQLERFSSALEEYGYPSNDIPKNWYDAFDRLKALIKSIEHNDKKVVFIDEVAWLDTPGNDFLGALESFWNGWASGESDVLLILCASATSWITNTLFKNKGGLYNRSSCRIYLRPFSLGETESYLKSRGVDWTRFDITETYMITGGVPFYLKQISGKLSFTQNIDQLFFVKDALLKGEFGSLYETLFGKSDVYMRIVRALFKKKIGLTGKEIADATKLSYNGRLGECLEDLVNSGFVRAYGFFGQKKKNITYQLCDYYTLFYLTYIEDQYGKDEHFWTNSIDTGQRRAWAGLCFEQVCKDHVEKIKQKIGIAGVLSEISSWFYRSDSGERGAQIDLVIDRNDRIISVCEMKFSESDFTITKQYDEILRNRRATFKEVTKTRKGVQQVFVTTYGLTDNAYSQTVQSVVTLDDLF